MTTMGFLKKRRDGGEWRKRKNKGFSRTLN
jgi:hypothetical protein